MIRPVRGSAAAVLTAVTAAVSAAGCGDGELDPDAIGNARLVLPGQMPVQLREGAGSDSTGRLYRVVASAPGDLDFDGQTDAAVLLAEADGISRYVTLHALVSAGGELEDVASLMVGEHIALLDLVAADGVIAAEILVQPLGSRMSAPPDIPVSAAWALTDRGLRPLRWERVQRPDVSPDLASPAGGQAPGAAATPGPDVPYAREWMLREVILDSMAVDDSAAVVNHLTAALRYQLAAEAAARAAETAEGADENLEEGAGDQHAGNQPAADEAAGDPAEETAADPAEDIIEPGSLPWLRFEVDLVSETGVTGTLEGADGCNRFFGSFRADEPPLMRVTPLASTARFCDGLVEEIASAMRHVLENVYRMDPDDGFLFMFSEDGRLVFQERSP